MRFDFTDLNLFRHIVEAGSITHGAARSNLALAAASTRIRKMELAFGTELLVRGRAGRDADARPAARCCSTRAPSWRRPNVCRRISRPYARGLAGQVRVLSNTNALTEFLPETLSSFLMAYPDISVDLEERLSDEIVGLIAEGTADIGIVAGTVDYGGLHTFPFRSDRFVLVVAKNHPLASRSRIGFAEVLDYDMVGLDRASAIQRFLADKANRIGRPLRLRVQLRSFDAICRLVECNVGVGIVPETTVQRTERTMAISAVRLTDSWALARTDHLRARCRRAAALCRGNLSIICGRRDIHLQRGMQHPVIEIEDHRRIVVVAVLERKIRARTILGRDGAHAQRADIVAARQFGARKYFRPGKYRAAGE